MTVGFVKEKREMIVRTVYTTQLNAAGTLHSTAAVQLKRFILNFVALDLCVTFALCLFAACKLMIPRAHRYEAA
jgi:cyanate permease